MNEEQMQNWIAGQIRSAIIIGLSLYAKQVAAKKASAANAANNTNAAALECAAYAEAALLRLKSILEYVTAAEHGSRLVTAIDAFLAAETAAGRIAVIGYWTPDGQWVNKSAAQFVADLKTAFAQRAVIRASK